MANDNKSNWLLPPIEVPKEQRALYESVKAEVNERATRLAEKRLNLPQGGRTMGMCHVIWYYKKQILKEEYGIEWHTPAETDPTTCFD